MDAFLATVSSIETKDQDGNPATARMLPKKSEGVVTRAFAIAWWLRAGDSQLKVGDDAICLQLDDGSGVVLMRPDGSWTKTMGGEVSAQSDFTAQGKSLAKHTHQGVSGQTSPPQ